MTTGPLRDKSILVIEWIRCATRRFRRDIVTADIYMCVSMRSGATRTLMSSSRHSTVAWVRGMQCRKVRFPLQSVRIPSLPVGTPLCWTGDHTEKSPVPANDTVPHGHVPMAHKWSEPDWSSDACWTALRSVRLLTELGRARANRTSQASRASKSKTSNSIHPAWTEYVKNDYNN